MTFQYSEVSSTLYSKGIHNIPDFNVESIVGSFIPEHQ